MPQIRDPFVHEVGGVLAAAPHNMLVTVKAAQPTREGRPTQAVMYVDVISIMDETTAAAVVDIGFMVGSHITWSRTLVCTNDTYWYRNHVHYTLTSDYQVVARFRIADPPNGAKVGDVVHMNVSGYYMEPYTSP
ncbi:unnamed protein product [marine sediment metagenome]|uniref:Uncharacterized protein n=1 Tax=marine sediment metagenome TaxID=412755 RepID=X1S5V7_9ZZZZ